MSVKYTSKPLALALGTAMTATLPGSGMADAGENPFSMTPLPGGYQLLAEGRCGEGKCGMQMMDADVDGKVTREEFMQGHEVMFDAIDANGNGVLDAEERAAHRAGRKAGCKMEGKYGGAK